MMIQMHVICIFLALHTFLTIYCSKYRFYEITAFNQRERRVLYAMYSKEKRIHFLNGISNEAALPIDVAVEEEYAQAFETKLQTYNIQYVYLTENLMDAPKVLNYTKEIDISKSFLEWDSIIQWVDSQVQKNRKIQKIVIAKTYERRDIFILKISSGNKKPIVFIVGSEDGKDWISSSVILNFLVKLLKDNNQDNSLLKYFDFYIVPILNPDGFVYSKIYDRFWSKNRREFFPAISCVNGSISVGVNIDRNWFHRKVSRLIEEECKNIYIGYEPLSEEETQTLSYVLNGLALNTIAFINLKGFSKFITIPYAHREPTNNHDIVMDILTSASTTLKEIYNVTYYVDTSNRLIYNFSGNMADWVKIKLNIPIVFTQYLEYKNYVLPKPNHILHLTQHFYTTLNETMIIAKDIYGPLFNNQRTTYVYRRTIITTFLIIAYNVFNSEIIFC